MSSIKNVAVAGAGGSLGTPVVKELIKAGFSVTALTRSDGGAFPTEVEVVKVDYEDAESLAQALKGQDAVVSTITTVGIESQKRLIDAVVAAKVKRFLPSEFGCDLENAKARELPVYGSKVEIEKVVKEKTKGTDTTYTFVFNNCFLDWGIDKGFMIDIKNKSMTLYDDGERQFTATPLEMVGKGVVGVLKHPEETNNTSVRIHGAKLTQNQFLNMAKKVVGSDGWTVKQASIAETEKQSYENLKKDPSNFLAWAFPQLHTAIFGEGFGGDFSSNNDNKLLGVQELSAGEVEEVIRDCAKTK